MFYQPKPELMYLIFLKLITKKKRKKKVIPPRENGFRITDKWSLQATNIRYELKSDESFFKNLHCLDQWWHSQYHHLNNIREILVAS